jgi:hypothetical protein
MNIPTFRIDRTSDINLTAQQASVAICNFTGATEGFIINHMGYMSEYQDAVKFTSVEDLEKAILEYCEKYNTNEFDYNSIYVVFVYRSKLKKIELLVNKKSTGEIDLTRELQRNLRDAVPKEATVYSNFFDVQFSKPPEPAKVFLPPFYNANGNHVGGGVPEETYPNLMSYQTYKYHSFSK